jgi:HPt (histidine-containing phosphotransfer) domain-containing protein
MPGTFDPQPLVAEYGDEALVRELAQLFVDNAESQLQNIFTAIDATDAVALRAGAHRLRGSVGTFGITAATELAQRLEHMGAAGTTAGARPFAEQLAESVRRFCAHASAWLGSGTDEASSVQDAVEQELERPVRLGPEGHVRSEQQDAPAPERRIDHRHRPIEG